MHVASRHGLTTLALLALVQLCTPALVLAQAVDTNAALERRVRALEKTQQRQLEQLRKARPAVDAAPVIDADLARQQEELDKRAEEIEQRIAAQEETPLFFTPSTAPTPEMRAYYARLVARLEDCGTRHTPKRGGRSVYGKGVVSIELDREGNAVSAKIERSSADELIDNHMLKLVTATSPFGPTPQRVRPQDKRRYQRLVVITSFAFKRDAKPSGAVDVSERCSM